MTVFGTALRAKSALFLKDSARFARQNAIASSTPRWFSSSEPPKRGARDFLWHMATFTAVGAAFVGVRWTMTNVDLTGDSEDAEIGSDGSGPGRCGFSSVCTFSQNVSAVANFRILRDDRSPTSGRGYFQGFLRYFY